MNTDFIVPLSRSIEVLTTANKVTKLVNLVKTMIYAIAASVIIINVVNIVRSSI